MALPPQTYPTVLDPVGAYAAVENGAVSALTADIDAVVTTIPVADTSRFETPGLATIGDTATGTEEVISFTGKTSTDLTGVTRGEDGTSAVPHVSGTKIEMRHVAAHHDLVVAGIRNIQTVLGPSPAGSFSSVRVRLDELAAAVSGASLLVRGFGLISDAPGGGSPPGAPSDGDVYVVNGWGAGVYVGDVVSPFANGDIVTYDSTLVGWKLVLANSGGFVPNGQRTVVTASGAGGGLTGHENKIAIADGLGGWTVSVPPDGTKVAEIGEQTNNEGRNFMFDTSPTTVWVLMPSGGLINPMTTALDMIYLNGSSVVDRLPVGAANAVLTVNGTVTDLIWSLVDLTASVTGVLPIANGGTGAATAQAAMNALSQVAVRGDILVADATPDMAILSLGASGQVLRSDGTDALWAAPLLADIDASSVSAGIPLQSDGSNIVGGETDSYISQAGPFAAAAVIDPGPNFATAWLSFGPLTAGTYEMTVNGFIDLPAGSTVFDIEMAFVNSVVLGVPLAGTLSQQIEDQAANLPHKVPFALFAKVAVGAIIVDVRVRVATGIVPAAITFNNITARARRIG